ncbi:zinc metallopeptidase [Flavobacterium cyanobacteriorum]|uniref:zinc metallopeptidase n=1 Tax=Flavobacterium cyanobacteriorum TaxID=2022802 RepID=UPI001A9C3B33|nr:zinc metallopeptidase [Flavobacterium cyanobacteriorum]
MIDLGSFLILGLIAIVSFAVSSKLKSKFEFYSKVRLRNGMSGAEIAEKMLHDHGIYDVRVISTPGRLTDHYNPADKTVNLSEAVYNERNAAAAAVAAHEVGHAVQHATAYSMLRFRSSLVPMVNIASGMSQWLLLIGVVLMASSGFGFGIAVAGLVLYAITTLFTFITLPVEYDASNRALAWLKKKNMVSQQEYAGAEDSLKWAARTYVVAAIGSLAMLVYFALRIFGGSRE